VRLIACLLLTVGLLGVATPAWAISSVELTGPELITPDEVSVAVAAPLESANGTVPDGILAADIAEAVREFYRDRGYEWVRVWHELDVESDTLRLHVDEGEMSRILFTGIDTVRSLMYRVDVTIPNDVFHRPTIEKAIADLRAKYGARDISWAVHETQTFQLNPFGEPIRQRELEFEVDTVERLGWGVGVAIDGRWGLVPKGRVKTRFFETDALEAKLEIGIPYRKFIFDEAASFQWTWGALSVDYRSPWLFDLLALGVEAETSLERSARPDLDIESYLLSDTSAFGLVSIKVADSIELEAGGGVVFAKLFDGTNEVTGEPVSGETLRGGGRLGGELDLTPEFRLRDEKDRVGVDLTVLDGIGAGVLFEAELKSSFTVPINPVRFIVRNRVLFMTGDVRIWEEKRLTGSYLRSLTDRFVREAIQLDLQFRWSALSWFELGAFYDVSGFVARDFEGNPFGGAQAVGPSLHFIVLDTVVIDTYYAFGWHPSGFAHNAYLAARAIF